MAFLLEDAAEGQVPGRISLITGKVDDIHAVPGQGTVHLSGRDFASLLVDAKIQGVREQDHQPTPHRVRGGTRAEGGRDADNPAG